MSGSLTMIGANSIQTTSNTTLTLGGNSTGNIVIDSNSSSITLSDNTTISGTLGGLSGLTLSSGSITLEGTAGTSSDCLKGGATAAWGSCAAGAGSNWDVVGGVITPKLASTLDLLLGSTATSTAKFAFTGVNSGTPTASISANSGANQTYLTGKGNLATTNMQTLTLGGSTTGDIVLNAGTNNIRIDSSDTLLSAPGLTNITTAA